MNTATFRILDYVYDVFIRLQWLVYPKNLQETLNKPFHGLEKEQVMNVLHHLFTEGYIVAKSDRDLDNQYFTPSLAELIDALERPFRAANMYYGLTEMGGARWEHHAPMNWDTYVYQVYGAYDKAQTNEGEIIASTQELAQMVLDEFKAERTPDKAIIQEEWWDMLTPWKATYWKTLPTGYRVQFRYSISPGTW